MAHAWWRDADYELFDRLTRERDEARAEVARLQDLHTRCAAFDDQPGPSCVTLKAEVARLREALEGIATEFERTVQHIDSKGKGGQHVPFHGDFAAACQLPSFCSRARWWATHLRAALAGTSDEVKR